MTRSFAKDEPGYELVLMKNINAAMGYCIQKPWQAVEILDKVEEGQEIEPAPQLGPAHLVPRAASAAPATALAASPAAPAAFSTHSPAASPAVPPAAPLPAVPAPSSGPVASVASPELGGSVSPDLAPSHASEPKTSPAPAPRGWVLEGLRDMEEVKASLDGTAADMLAYNMEIAISAGRPFPMEPVPYEDLVGDQPLRQPLRSWTRPRDLRGMLNPDHYI